MIEIIFRGKRVDNGEWVEGNLVCLKNLEDQPYQCFIISQLSYLEYGEFDEMYQVFPEMVGQFTGMTDKNGKRIFDGDIVKATGTNDHIGYVTFECGKFITRCTCHPKSVCDIHPPIEELIGNIHDNGELLTEERSDNEN
jgi:uncharacterized phage protein (TIGR01671 family)